MRGRIAAAGSVVLFSLLLTFVLGEDNATLNSIDYENEEEETLVEQEDLVMEDAEYEYEVVVGEEKQRNVVEFHKHPGVYVIDLEGVLYALDADNGDILWARKVSDRLMRVEESPIPPVNYPERANGSSLQCISLLCAPQD